MKSAAILAGLQFLSFLIVTLNFRFCAKGRIGATVFTDVLLSALGFTILKRMITAGTGFEMAGYVVGSCLGSIAGMFITKGLKDAD